jgi:hypothetical protein
MIRIVEKLLKVNEANLAISHGRRMTLTTHGTLGLAAQTSAHC